MVKRAIVIVIGVILLLGGLVTAVAGGALMALFGSSSTLSSGQERVSTSTNSLVGLLILVLSLRMRQGPPDARYAGAGGTQGYQPPAGNVRM
jgi:hypothetical protein